MENDLKKCIDEICSMLYTSTQSIKEVENAFGRICSKYNLDITLVYFEIIKSIKDYIKQINPLTSTQFDVNNLNSLECMILEEMLEIDPKTAEDLNPTNTSIRISAIQLFITLTGFPKFDEIASIDEIWESLRN